MCTRLLCSLISSSERFQVTSPCSWDPKTCTQTRTSSAHRSPGSRPETAGRRGNPYRHSEPERQTRDRKPKQRSRRARHCRHPAGLSSSSAMVYESTRSRRVPHGTVQRPPLSKLAASAVPRHARFSRRCVFGGFSFLGDFAGMKTTARLDAGCVKGMRTFGIYMRMPLPSYLESHLFA